MLQITGVNLYLESIKYSVEQVPKENENVQVSRLLEIVDCTEKNKCSLKKRVKIRKFKCSFFRCFFNWRILFVG